MGQFKVCSRCKGDPQSLSSFSRCVSKRDGRQPYCKACCKEYQAEHSDHIRKRRRRWRKANPKTYAKQLSRRGKIYREKYPEKIKAKAAVKYAVQHGYLIRGVCEVCGTTGNVEGHHPDYTKPLEVTWLCREHHRAEHRRLNHGIT